jgi:hypothetical protein
MASPEKKKEGGGSQHRRRWTRPALLPRLTPVSRIDPYDPHKTLHVGFDETFFFVSSNYLRGT